MEEKEYEFVHETIKKKPVNKKKLLRRTVLTAALAVVFGLVACVTFLLIEPVINNVLNPEKISKVEFPEEKKEVKPQELLTEESVARQEVQRQEAAVEEAKEEAIQSATTAFGIDQYKELYQDLYAYAQDSMDFMVSVIGISEMQDWLQGTFENENTTAGLILADNTAELLILADTGSMGNASQYYVRFCDKQMTEAHIKQKDSQTGLEHSRWSSWNTINFTQKLPWKLTFGLNGGFNIGNEVESVYAYSEPSHYWYASLSRSFLKEDRLSVRLSAGNLFGPDLRSYPSHTVQGDFRGTQTWLGSQRHVGISISWRFGSLRGGVKSVDRTIENDDIVGGISTGGGNKQ